MPRPNVLFVFADQWRAQAAAYAGDPNARTPDLDCFAAESVNFTTAVSVCPVCTPARASLITGQYPLTHGLFLNDLCLGTGAVSIAQAFNAAGYDTGYIGKWHLDGHGRSGFTPPERRQGFRFWRAIECNHNYHDAPYYADSDEKLTWPGYEPEAQTAEAVRYMTERRSGEPFALFLSWGPPHTPYGTAPDRFRAMYPPDRITLRPNVPPESVGQGRRDLAGYYAHIAAMDECFGALIRALDDFRLRDSTIVVFTSDHGDLLGSHGQVRKQQPYDESLLVPFLLRCPEEMRVAPRAEDVPFNTPDIMPTLLGLCGVPIPPTVEGIDFSPRLKGRAEPDVEAALLACYAPFGEWHRGRGGKEYRGVRTRQHTYVRDLSGPWLLFDNRSDPFQLRNLCGRPDHADAQRRLDGLLLRLLAQTRDNFEPAEAYLRRWGYRTDRYGQIPYTA